MKSLCTKGILYFSLALLVVGAAACTQTKPAAPTPTLVPLPGETIVSPEGLPTAIIIDNVTPSTGGEPTLVPPPTGNETPVPATGETPASTDGQNPTPIVVEPTLLPTPTTVGDTGQPVPTPASGDNTGQQPTGGTGTCSNPYTVQPGEWFYAIARKCGVTPQALLAANPGMNPSVLRPGQTMNIPGGSTGGQPPSGDNTNPPPPSGGGSCSNPYTVERGDTINSISRKCGVSVSALLQANGIPDPNYIFPGQQLRLP